MKIIRTNKRVIAGALAVLFAAPVFGGTMERKPAEEELKSKAIEMSQDPFFKKSIENQESITYKIYNEQDDLIYETTSNSNKQDITLVKLLNRSDLLATNDKTSYFRLNK